MKKHEHAEVIKAYADGHELEFRPKPSSYGSVREWHPCRKPDFDLNFEYRVKRERT